MATNPAADNLGGRSASGAPIALPPHALVALVGVAASGKSTFATRHFAPTRIVSSDAMRAMIADDAAAQEATDDAFDLLHRLIAMRLARGRLTVVDATNVEGWARQQLVAIARRHRRPAVAIVLDIPLDVALARNAARTVRRPPPAALRRQHRLLAESMTGLESEGFADVHVLRSAVEIEEVRIEGGV
ncbi:MAG: AAA family ATPase [Candidatus Limnocylindria bacterium]